MTTIKMTRGRLPWTVLVALAMVVGTAGAVGAAEEENPETQLLEVGTTAPAFEALDEQGNRVRLADHAGEHNVVLVFYPVDNTPLCTRQLCEIRDHWDDFDGGDVQAYGVNPGDATSHLEFSEKHEFPFPLLVDEGQVIARAYGCFNPMAPMRTVYGIDKDGEIVLAQRGKPDVAEILEAFGIEVEAKPEE